MFFILALINEQCQKITSYAVRLNFYQYTNVKISRLRRKNNYGNINQTIARPRNYSSH